MERPGWLTRGENGSIGEARTRAFLIDRFWVLERSVDIEGADLVIQRRLLSRSLLDKSPPRFGIVQAKFIQSPATTHYVHKEYVLDPDGRPRKEFFLVAHSGAGHEARVFVLSGQDLVSNFRLTGPEHSKPNRFAIPGRALLVDGSFEVHDSRPTLARMDAAIAEAEFLGNRNFLSWALPSLRAEEAIDPMYLEPLDNWYGNIPEAFEELRKEAQSAWWRLEEVAEKLRKIIETRDPAEALEAAEDLKIDYGASVTLSLSGWGSRGLYNEDLHTVVLMHKRAVTVLREHGRLDEFLGFKRRVQEAIADRVCSAGLEPKAEVICRIKIRFEPAALRFFEFDMTLEPCPRDAHGRIPTHRTEVRLSAPNTAEGVWVPYLGPDYVWDGKTRVEHPVVDLRRALVERTGGWASELIFAVVAELYPA